MYDSSNKQTHNDSATTKITHRQIDGFPFKYCANKVYLSHVRSHVLHDTRMPHA